MNLWLDDVRPAPEGWFHAHTVSEAKALLESGAVMEASLDHDLGMAPPCENCAKRDCSSCICDCHIPEESGYQLVVWMACTGKWPRTKPFVHSANPVGARAMRQMIDRYWASPVD